jgi:hypothetical protein
MVSMQSDSEPARSALDAEELVPWPPMASISTNLILALSAALISSFFCSSALCPEIPSEGVSWLCRSKHSPTTSRSTSLWYA